MTGVLEGLVQGHSQDAHQDAHQEAHQDPLLVDDVPLTGDSQDEGLIGVAPHEIYVESDYADCAENASEDLSKDIIQNTPQDLHTSWINVIQTGAIEDLDVLLSSVNIQDIPVTVVFEGCELQAGMTPLGLACYYCKPDIVAKLIASGADTDIPIKLPSNSSLPERLRGLLLGRFQGSSSDKNLVSLLYTTLATEITVGSDHFIDADMSKEATRQAKIQIIKELFKSNFTPLTSWSARALMERSGTKYYYNLIGDAITAAREEGFDINAENKMHRTPLISVILFNYREMIELLVERGADVNAANSDKVPPLLCAIRDCGDGVVRLLIEKGASIDVESPEGVTPLLCAVRHCKEEVIRLLIEKGVDINRKSPEGVTPLIMATKYNYADIVKLLIANGAHVNFPDNEEVTPLMIASAKNNIGILEILITHGADIKATKGNGWYILAIAASEGYVDQVKLLIEKGVDINSTGTTGFSALAYASVYYHVDTVKLLLEKGAQVNRPADDGAGALAWAKTLKEELEAKITSEPTPSLIKRAMSWVKSLFGATQLKDNHINTAIEGNINKISQIIKLLEDKARSDFDAWLVQHFDDIDAIKSPISYEVHKDKVLAMPSYNSKGDPVNYHIYDYDEFLQGVPNGKSTPELGKFYKHPLSAKFNHKSTLIKIENFQKAIVDARRSYELSRDYNSDSDKTSVEGGSQRGDERDEGSVKRFKAE